MAYEIVHSESGEYAVDWSIVFRLVRSHLNAKLRDEYSEVKTMSQSTWNPFSWSMPEISSVEVQWDEVRSKSNIQAFTECIKLRNRGDVDMRGVAYTVRDMVRSTERYNAKFLDLMAATQSQNMDRMNNSVSAYETRIEIARFFRDSSADALMVGATIATGGTGAAILAGGSTLKGYARYQDTDNVAAGVLTGVGNLGFGAFQIGGGSKTVLVVVQAAWETGTCLVEGKGFAESVATGSLKLGGLAVNKVFSTDLVKNLVGLAAVPLTITLGGTDVSEKVIEGIAKKLLQKQGIERAGKKVINAVEHAFEDEPPSSGPSLIQSATLGDELLLQFAVVHMEKGIGHGW